MKKCTVCKEEKPFEEFYNSKTYKDGKSYRCKSCDNLARKKYENKNKFKSRENRRNALLKYKYNLSSKDVEELFNKQNGLCAICNNPGFQMLNTHEYPLNVDHCHATRKVRGLLCHNCNRGLGLFKDNIDYLEKAITYLKENNNGEIH